MKITYRPKQFSKSSLTVIAAAHDIFTEYKRQGFILTLRQLYYQFVSRGLLPNRPSEYKRLGEIMSDARLAGLIDWESIEDRTRERVVPHFWEDVQQLKGAMRSEVEKFTSDQWETQPYRVEVWIEKDALSGVIDRICRSYQVPYFACKGYTSQSEMWRAGRRFMEYAKGGQTAIILHLGDHDPSGIDMTRDIQDRLNLFEAEAEVRRIALTMDQIEELNPPPNPAKTTDSRFQNYIAEYGEDSWELDALPPRYIASLVENHIQFIIDDDQWQRALKRDRATQKTLRKELSYLFDKGGAK